MKKTIIALATILATTLSYANTDSLRNKITEYCSNYKATVGISVIFIEDADTLSVNGHKMLPMLSVYKLPIAMCVLNNVDKGDLHSIRLSTYLTKICTKTLGAHYATNSTAPTHQYSYQKLYNTPSYKATTTAATYY